MSWQEFPGVRGKPYWVLGRIYGDDYWAQSYFEIWFDPNDDSWVLSRHLAYNDDRDDRLLTEADRAYYLANPDVLLVEEAL